MSLGQFLVPGPASVRLLSRSPVQAFTTRPPGPLRRPAIAQSQFSQNLVQNICRRHGQEVGNMCGQLIRNVFSDKLLPTSNGTLALSRVVDLVVPQIYQFVGVKGPCQ